MKNEDHIVWSSHEFDYETIRRCTRGRYTREDIQQHILEFDGLVELHGLAGYIDSSRILIDSMMCTVPPSEIFKMMRDPNARQTVSTEFCMDYFASLCDYVTDNEENHEAMEEIWVERITFISDQARLLFNFFVLGLTANLSDEELDFYATHILEESCFKETEDFKYTDALIRLAGDLIIFPCSIPLEVTDSGQERIHAVYLNAINSGLSRNAPRDKLRYRQRGGNNKYTYAEDPSRRLGRGNTSPFRYSY